MRLLKVVLAGVGLGLLCGCGNGGSDIAEQGPLREAVRNYCRDKNYGMAIKEVVAAKAAGEGKAVMTCKMKEAEGLYGMAVSWEFTLRREGDRWVVDGHVAK